MKGLSRLLIAAIACGALGAAVAQEKPAPPKRTVEVVFVLDTTGSMSGLIAAAKQKVWSIANTLASAQPAPRIRMGLVAYRDRGDAYVTRLTDLSEDLDAVYANLMRFEANGGGDGPESVNQALHEAVTKVAWGKEPGAFRVVFLVGDCPPHMDYKDDVKYPETCKAAAAAGIVINTIQCGNQAETTPVWREIADRAEGQSFRVEQAGGAVAAATPFDARIAELGRDLAGTRVHYGTAAEREELRERARSADEVAAGAPAPAAASRAEFMSREAGATTLGGGKDLVADAESGKVKLGEMKAEEMPDELKVLTPEERDKYVRDMAAKRKAVQEEIGKLSEQRQAYIKEQIEKAPATQGKQSLDAAIYDCIRKQAALCGIEYKEGPVY